MFLLMLIGQTANLQKTIAALNTSPSVTAERKNAHPINVNIVGASESVPVTIVSDTNVASQLKESVDNPYRKIVDDIRTEQIVLASYLEKPHQSDAMSKAGARKEYRVFHDETDSRMHMSAIALSQNIEIQLKSMSLDGYRLVGMIPIVKDIEAGGVFGESDIVGRTVGSILVGERDLN